MKITKISITFVVVMVFCAGLVRAGTISPELQAVLGSASSLRPIPIIIRFVDTVDLKSYRETGKALRRSKADRALRRSKLIKALKGKTEAGQVSLRKFLRNNGIKRNDIQVLWMINALAVTVPAELVAPIAARPDVDLVTLDEALDEELVSPAGVTGGSAMPEWNIDDIRAPELWALGYDGSGIVVATMDSGVDIFHPDLGPKWRGGANSWYDPNGEHDSPYDNTGHGTQVLGLILGGDAGGTAIGVAPGAQWIAVKIYDDSGKSSLSRIHQSFQWLLDPDGDPLSDDSPDIVNNSWYLASTVDLCNAEFESDIAALRAADIAVVFSAGNTGPSPATSVSPCNNPGSVAVGATDAFFNPAGFSARGPSACDGGIYPSLVAPGADVLTADRTFGGIFPDSYISVSGTSFAAPHVAGAMALLLNYDPLLTVTDLESVLQASAVDLGPDGPDNDTGFGLLDVLGAYLDLTGATTAPVAVNDSGSVKWYSKYRHNQKKRSKKQRNKQTSANERTFVTLNVVANDYDPDGSIDPTTVTIVSPPDRGGRAIANGDGTITFRPKKGFWGTVNFKYSVKDDEGIDSNAATVTIKVFR